jgi:hypothetical protein
MSMKVESAGATRARDGQLQFSWAATPRHAGAGSLPRPGRGVRPRSRPIRGVEAPSAMSRSRAPRACAAEAAVATPVRLTERGVALILLAGLLLMVTAATVVALTAFRVTSPDYLPYGQSQVAQTVSLE